ncbi:MAG: multidrug effflux MFS transporter [Cypionkella sp.]|jgi:MFS transporter, DHA1 family, multidrug resistance protein
MQSPTRRLSHGEFVALIAALFATIALSIDAMLPALPQIAADFSPSQPNNAQLVITSFVFGMGVGTLFTGPLSDSFGRKPVIIAGGLLYMLSSVAAYFAQSLEVLLISRVVMGLGAAGPRTAATALVRDLFEGRAMAQVMSFVMMVFMLVPAVAPLMGQTIMHIADWQAIFLVYIGFSVVTMIWLGLRQPETLPASKRRKFSVVALMAGVREVFSHRIVVISILMQSLTLAALFATLSSMQGIFELRFDRGASFAYWFALIALCSAIGNVINAKTVVRYGMRRLIWLGYAGLMVITAVLLAVKYLGLMPEALAFPMHMVWTVVLFGAMGLQMGNLNALAMEPLGHIAGLSASIITALSTVISVVMAVPVGLAFDGSELPLMLGVLVFNGLALALFAFDKGR